MSNKVETDIKLLDDCIVHWTRMAMGFTLNNLDQPIASRCALCVVYLRRTGRCTGCPISIYTGKGHCEDTPYQTAHDWYWDQWGEEDRKRYHNTCRHMLAFLRVVRDDLQMRFEHDGKVLVNGMRTPDGTEIFSRSRHDFVTHLDKNGVSYMVDGGLEYIRRSHNPDDPAEDLSVIVGHMPFKQIREMFTWGTYGRNGSKELKWKYLMHLSRDHLRAIINDGYPLSWLMSAELNYREYMQLSGGRYVE